MPNPIIMALLDAGLLRPVSSLYRHDVLGPGLPDRFRDPHAFFTWTGWTGFPEVYVIGRAAQEQVARFFLSGGRQIDAVIPQLETAGRLPAARP